MVIPAVVCKKEERQSSLISPHSGHDQQGNRHRCDKSVSRYSTKCFQGPMLGNGKITETCALLQSISNGEGIEIGAGIDDTDLRCV